MSFLVLTLLGLGAGALTTVTGVGGGMLLLLSLALWFDPATALAITAPGLLAGNLHRLALFRRHLRVDLAARLALGALPGALVGGLVAVRLPAGVLQALLVVATVAAVAKSLGWIRLQPNRHAVLPVGAVAGFFTATSGGGGILVPPTLLTLGVTGPAYLATAAAAAATMHLGRLTAYGFAGWMDEQRWLWAGALAVAIPLGNLIGRATRRRLSDRAVRVSTHAALIAVCLLAALGIG